MLKQEAIQAQSAQINGVSELRLPASFSGFFGGCVVSSKIK